MNVVGIGAGLVECPRIGRMIEQHGELFLRRVYTDREVRYCQARRRPLEHFAALWAGKEAILKALGATHPQALALSDLEIRRIPRGLGPRVVLGGGAGDYARGRGVGEVLVSLAHCRTYASASAIALVGRG